MHSLYLLLILHLLTFAPAPPPKPRPPIHDLKAMQGRWIAKRVTLPNTGGQWTDGEIKLAVTGNRMRFNDSEEQRLHLGADKNLKTFKFTTLTGENAGQTVQCIYRLERNTLTLCWHLGSGKQPTRLDGTEKDTVVAIFKRYKS